MGEYARIDGRQIKAGTCSDMYYLRMEDAARAVPEPGSDDPSMEGMRYRLPFPDEDEVGAGNYQPYNRGQRPSSPPAWGPVSLPMSAPARAALGLARG